MKKFLLLLLIPTIVNAQTRLDQGGTGANLAPSVAGFVVKATTASTKLSTATTIDPAWLTFLALANCKIVGVTAGGGALECNAGKGEVGTSDVANGSIRPEDADFTSAPSVGNCIKYDSATKWGAGACSGGVADADYGDITVSSSGTAWGIDPSVVKFDDVDNSISLTSGAAMDVGEAWFDYSDGGVIFEGGSSDAIEGALVAFPTTSDKTWTLPDVTGTIVTTGDTGSINSTMLAVGSVTNADVATDAINSNMIIDSTVDFMDAQNSLTLSANPAMDTGEAWFSYSEGGLIFEGVSDSVEGALVAWPSTSDKTWTLPDVTGTIVTTGDTGSVGTAMVANATIRPEDADFTSAPSVGNCIKYDSATKWGAGACGGVSDLDYGDITVSGSGLTWNIDSGVVGTAEIGDASLAFNDVDNTGTIAADPAYAAGEAWFGTTGIIFEGATANLVESLLTVADPTTTDKTWTLPDVTGTIVTTGDTGSINSTMLAVGSVTNTDVATDAINSNMIIDSTIGTADIADGTIGTDDIALNTIQNVDIAPNTITGTEIANDAIAFGEVNNSITLAADPALAAGEAWFGTTGIIFEGATANLVESLLTVADPTTSDKTWTLPDVTGTIITTGDTSTVTSAMIGVDVVAAVDIATGGVDTAEILDASVAFNDINNLGTIVADPAYAAGEAWFGTTGIIFEGATADLVESLLTVADPTTSDKTWTLPNVTGTIVTTGDTGSITSTMLGAGSVTNADVATDAITTTMIVDSTIGGIDIFDGTVTTDDIADGTITNADVGSNILTAANLAASSVGTSELTDATVAFADINNLDTLAADPAYAASEAWFGTTGIIFEGATANTVESLLTVADPTTSDKTWTLPDVTGTLPVTTFSVNTTGQTAAVVGGTVGTPAVATLYDVSVTCTVTTTASTLTACAGVDIHYTPGDGSSRGNINQNVPMLLETSTTADRKSVV